MMIGEKRDLTSSQYSTLTIGFIFGSTLVLSFMDTVAKQDSWLVLLVALVLSIPFILCYTTLNKWYEGKNLVEINEAVFGKYIGKFVSALYIIYFFLLLSFNIRDVADFYNGQIMFDTPQVVFLVVFMLVSGYAVKKGISNIARVSLFTVLAGFLTIAITFTLLLNKMDFSNFLPVFEMSPIAFIKATLHFMIVPFCELAVFMMVAPSLSSTQHIGRNAVLGLVIAAFTFLLAIVRNTTVLGISSSIYHSASYESVRMINIGEFLTRVELLIGLAYTMMLFTKISVLYYATTKSLSQVFQLRTYSPLILPVGAIAIVLAVITYSSTTSHYEFAKKYNVFLISLFEFILPPVTLLIAKVRRSILQVMNRYTKEKAAS